MPVTVTASAQPLLNISYTLEQVESDTPTNILTEYANVGSNSIFFSDGTGIGRVNLGVKSTGYLPSGGTVFFDATAMPKEIFYGSITGNFSLGIKGVIITNTLEPPSATPATEMPYFYIRATGTNRFSNLFSGGSGNVKVGPKSTWAVTNYLGFFPNPANKAFSLVDSGSGVPYELLFVGITGDNP